MKKEIAFSKKQSPVCGGLVSHFFNGKIQALLYKK
jgi:hypothetical protein